MSASGCRGRGHHRISSIPHAAPTRDHVRAHRPWHHERAGDPSGSSWPTMPSCCARRSLPRWPRQRLRGRRAGRGCAGAGGARRARAARRGRRRRPDAADPHDRGPQAARAIRAGHPAIAILVLSQYVETRYAVDLLRDDPAGVGYLLKERVTRLDGSRRRRATGRGGRLGHRPRGRGAAARPSAAATRRSTS